MVEPFETLGTRLGFIMSNTFWTLLTLVGIGCVLLSILQSDGRKAKLARRPRLRTLAQIVMWVRLSLLL